MNRTLTNGSLALVFFAIGCSAIGQIVLKLGMTRVGQIDGSAFQDPINLFVRVFTSPLVATGLGVYVLSTVAWLTVLSRVPLSVAYPMVGFTYALTAILAWQFLGETMPFLQWMGIVTICLGVVLVSRS
jgi:multidrug transporter EmrE-like cation transporter